MTATIFDVDIMEVLDFDPTIPCQYEKWHELFMSEPVPPAKWVLYYHPVLPCGCVPKNPIEAVCAWHWETFATSPGTTINCGGCQAPITRISLYVSRIETVKR